MSEYSEMEAPVQVATPQPKPVATMEYPSEMQDQTDQFTATSTELSSPEVEIKSTLENVREAVNDAEEPQHFERILHALREYIAQGGILEVVEREFESDQLVVMALHTEERRNNVIASTKEELSNLSDNDLLYIMRDYEADFFDDAGTLIEALAQSADAATLDRLKAVEQQLGRERQVAAEEKTAEIATILRESPNANEGDQLDIDAILRQLNLPETQVGDTVVPEILPVTDQSTAADALAAAPSEAPSSTLEATDVSNTHQIDASTLEATVTTAGGEKQAHFKEMMFIAAIIACDLIFNNGNGIMYGLEKAIEEAMDKGVDSAMIKLGLDSNRMSADDKDTIYSRMFEMVDHNQLLKILEKSKHREVEKLLSQLHHSDRQKLIDGEEVMGHKLTKEEVSEYILSKLSESQLARLEIHVKGETLH